jgi:hypothetical protein
MPDACSCSSDTSSSSSAPKCPFTGDPHKPPVNESNSEGTKTCDGGSKATNAVGLLGPKTFAITQTPYKVFSCDQVIIAPGYTFIDPSNYLFRKSALFTLTAYIINQFDSTDPKTLRTQILMNDVTEVPEIIMGAPDCLRIIDNRNSKQIDMCFDGSKAAQIKLAIDEFIKCRMGDNLKKMTAAEVSKIFKSACLGRTENVPDLSSENKYIGYLKSFLPLATPKPNNLRGVNPAYGTQIPGSVNFNTDEFHEKHRD